MSLPAKVPWKFSATALVFSYTKSHGGIVITNFDFFNFSQHSVREAATRLTKWGVLKRIKPGVYALQQHNTHHDPKVNCLTHRMSS